MIAKLLRSALIQGFIGLSGLIFAAYTYWASIKTPNLEVQRMSTTSVVDIPEAQSVLKIFYDGQLLAQGSKALQIVTIRLINSGEQAIRIGDYDTKYPVKIGLREGGVIALPKVTRARTPYLGEATKIFATSNPSMYGVTPAIFEPGDWVDVRLVAIRSDGGAPQVVAEGKIAGQSSISIVDTPGSDEPLARQAFGGGIAVNAFRLVGACGILFFLFLTYMAIVGGARDLPVMRAMIRNRRLREGIANEYITERQLTRTKLREFFFGHFVIQDPEQNRFKDLTMCIRAYEALYDWLNQPQSDMARNIMIEAHLSRFNFVMEVLRPKGWSQSTASGVDRPVDELVELAEHMYQKCSAKNVELVTPPLVSGPHFFFFVDDPIVIKWHEGSGDAARELKSEEVK